MPQFWEGYGGFLGCHCKASHAHCLPFQNRSGVFRPSRVSGPDQCLCVAGESLQLTFFWGGVALLAVDGMRTVPGHTDRPLRVGEARHPSVWAEISVPRYASPTEGGFVLRFLSPAQLPPEKGLATLDSLLPHCCSAELLGRGSVTRGVGAELS